MDEIDPEIWKRFNPKALEKLYKKCYIDLKTGYYRFKDSHKYVHIWIMEIILGRKLRNGEVVHHMNENKLDNHPSNLMLFENQKEHTEWHQEQLEVSGVW